jgi:hypothetical protein
VSTIAQRYRKEAAIATKKVTRDLFQRLRPLGFDEKFVRRVVLPDWWEDGLAEVPANRALAEMAISRHLGMPLSVLRRPDSVLQFPALPNVCLKRIKNSSFEDVRASIFVAQRAAELACENLKEIPRFPGVQSASGVRALILKKHETVTLASMVEFCWSQGIAVVHVSFLPKASKRIQGMALFVQDRPVIVLASRFDAPPRLAFHLVHELGHIFLKHVKLGDGPLADGDLDDPDENPDEKHADEFACEILTGRKKPAFESKYNLTAEKLAKASQEFGEHHQIDPGTVALCYGYYKKLFGSAQAALKLLNQHEGAHQIIARALRSRLALDDLTESSERFLSVLTAPMEGTENA